MSERRFTRVGGHRVHSLHAGGGAPVVLLHGLCGSHRWWRYTLPALTPHFRVHVPELVGFGRTTAARPHPSLAEMARVVTEWIAGLEEGPVALVGHSMGGQVAIHLAVREDPPLRRLVLTAAAGVPRPLSLAQLPRMLAQVVPPRRWGSPAFLPTIAADVLRTGPRTTLAATHRILTDDVRPLLPSVRVPTLLLWGELDPLVPVADGRVMRDAIPDARLVVLSGAAHNPMADRPSAFNHHLIAFLREEA
ncbi:MAG TPA: alpha/beta hydrolase [Longimicrobiales bacterium]|nr:alpha/beta hydrolase [Longimicrobiales bacterium]